MGESERKILISCPRRRWEDNTQAVGMNLRKAWRGSLGLIRRAAGEFFRTCQWAFRFHKSEVCIYNLSNNKLVKKDTEPWELAYLAKICINENI
jgi:hypothetical protein